MKVGSLFSGIGGLDLGFEREGFEIAWMVENDLFCQAVLRKHFPGAKIYGDVKEINFRELEPVEVLIGGFPCQDVSFAGKRKGMAGQRTSLWKEFARAISELQPRYAIMENVPGLISLGLDEVLADLAEIGYDSEWTTLCASDFGALHKRERIFIIAYPGCERCLEHGTGFNADKTRLEAFDELDEGVASNSNGKQHFKSKCGVNAAACGVAEENGAQYGSSRKFNRTTDGRGCEGYAPHFITNDWDERVSRFREESLQGGGGLSWCKDVRRIEDLKGRPDVPESLFRGGRDGVPNWVERIKSLGNSVVPVCAQFIARRIKETDAKIRGIVN